MDDHGGDWDPEAGTQQAAERRERRHLLIVAGPGLLAGVLLAIVVIAVGGGPAVDGRLLLVMGLVVGLLVVLSGAMVALVWWRRRNGSRTFARSPLWELPSFRQRSRLVKALRRGEPIPAELRPLAVRVARDIIGRRGLVWLYLGLAVLQAGNVFLQVGWARWGALALALGFLAAAGYFSWLRGRVRRALAQLQS